MSKKEYTEDQIQEVLKNKYVKNCSSKYITFTDEFKIKVLELDKKWIYHRKIFEDFWFPEYIINSDIPKNSLSRWKRNINKKGIIEDKKWKVKKEEIDFDNMTKDEELEYLRAKVAYLEEISEYMKSWLP